MRSVFFFFFKQKTAYEMLRSLVGSEMCIRDRSSLVSTMNLEAGPVRSGCVIRADPTFGAVAGFKLVLHDIEARGEARNFIILVTHPNLVELQARLPHFGPRITAAINRIQQHSDDIRRYEVLTSSTGGAERRKQKNNEELRVVLKCNARSTTATGASTTSHRGQ
eukprot:TRINITY_DN63822_c0_g1_i1.p1 TRINITY_DN63822_c0_g1~~TRINITY_DN63822_c0_g1_i1.p1  ORF type:complete len:165 (+),score=39.55 TRINITY_DN63822_c0_g1_i1:59-553(+)